MSLSLEGYSTLYYPTHVAPGRVCRLQHITGTGNAHTSAQARARTVDKSGKKSQCR